MGFNNIFLNIAVNQTKSFYLRVKLSFDVRIQSFLCFREYRQNPVIMKYLQISKAIDCMFIRLLKISFYLGIECMKALLLCLAPFLI